MKKLIFILSLMLTSISYSQCDYIQDTTITSVDYNINMNSNAVQDSNLCTDIIILSNVDTTWFTVEFIATSNIIVVDYTSYGFGDNGCWSYVSQGWWLTTLNCDTLEPTPYGQWVHPIPDQNGNTNSSGWKHFQLPDSLVGETLVARRWFKNNTGNNPEDRCELTPCVAMHSVGDVWLNIDNEIVKRELVGNPYPNPTYNIVNFKVSPEFLHVYVHNVKGQLVQSGFKYDGENNYKFECEGLENGLYFFTFYDVEGNTMSKKVMVNH